MRNPKSTSLLLTFTCYRMVPSPLQRFILVFAVLLCSGKASLSAQSFTAVTGEIFVNEPKGNYMGGMQVLTGVMKKGETIEAYAETGRKFTLKITKLEVGDNKDAAEARPGQYVFVHLYTAEDASGGSDYLRKGYKVYPKGFKVSGNSTANTTSTQRADFTATLDGKAFKAEVSYKGALLYRKGIENYQPKPFLQLSFRSIQSPDTRQLLIQILNPKGAPAKYGVKDMEVNFSGTADGNPDHTTIYGFVNGKADTEFTVEITQWQAVSSTKAIISGKIYGELREVKILGKAKTVNKIANGVFENVEVEIYSESADMKEMMKGR